MKQFTIASKLKEGIEVQTYQLICGTFQSDLMVGLGRKTLVDRAQYKTESGARKWALAVIKEREVK